MPVAPTNEISETLASVRSLLANSSAFQAWCGVDEEMDPVTAALDYITLLSGEPEDVTNVHVIIDSPESYDATNISQGAWTQRGRVRLYFRAVTDAEQASADKAMTFLNNIGGVVTDIRTLGNGYTYLFARSVGIESAPRLVDAKEEGYTGEEFIDCEVYLEFGVS